MSLPEETGEYRVNIYGDAPEGASVFSVAVTSSVEGLAGMPIATVWWPNTSDDFSLSVQVEGVDADAVISLEVAAADGKVTTLAMDLYEPAEASQCRQPLSGGASVTGIETLGEAPYSALLDVSSSAGTYRLS